MVATHDKRKILRVAQNDRHCHPEECSDEGSYRIHRIDLL